MWKQEILGKKSKQLFFLDHGKVYVIQNVDRMRTFFVMQIIALQKMKKKKNIKKKKKKKICKFIQTIFLISTSKKFTQQLVSYFVFAIIKLSQSLSYVHKDLSTVDSQQIKFLGNVKFPRKIRIKEKIKYTGWIGTEIPTSEHQNSKKQKLELSRINFILFFQPTIIQKLQIYLQNLKLLLNGHNRIRVLVGGHTIKVDQFIITLYINDTKPQKIYIHNIQLEKSVNQLHAQV
eukprot:TRINITY_DN34498_c0_g1_i1.p2 TRINITY_DN34498_c0_g1~~TRINITY_DN34498_c0_g1_i1.p2  ORF type:complete len:233 (-),score=9.92 TRINITY_DN34498_c0_g1_i1:187-885(-)